MGFAALNPSYALLVSRREQAICRGGVALKFGWPADLTWYTLLYSWQSLIAGLIAIIAAIIAAVPVWRQFKLLRIQSEVNSRAVLVMRVSAAESRRDTTRQKLSFTNEFISAVHQDEGDDGQPDINSEWAHSAEQQADAVRDFLIGQQATSLDGELIDAKRNLLIEQIKELCDCLNKIHAPFSHDFSGSDYDLTRAEIAAISDDGKSAEINLEDRIMAVIRSASDLDAAFEAGLVQIRTHIRQIDDLITRQRRLRTWRT